MSTIIDGKKIAMQIRKGLKKQVDSLKSEQDIVPGLAVILVGEDPASKIYINMKKKACEKIGIYSEEHNLPIDISEEKLLNIIKELNKNKKIHGILVQLPLPKHINTTNVIYAIDPKKDVDGFHPENVGLLMIGEPRFRPCTPYGIIKLLESIGCQVKGKHAVIIGRSMIVGKPVAAMLLHRHATVTICHSRTKNIEKIVKEADILVAAVGKPKFVKGSWIKKDAVVIDVGTNKLPDGSLVGDVDFNEALSRVGAITPVPKGVGPMTITLLLSNTVEATQL